MRGDSESESQLQERSLTKEPFVHQNSWVSLVGQDSLGHVYQGLFAKVKNKEIGNIS